MDRSNNGTDSDGAVKYDANKPAYHLVDMEFVAEVIRCYTAPVAGVGPEFYLRCWVGDPEPLTSLRRAFNATAHLYGTDNPKHVAQLELARVLGAGARKYTANNWRKGFHWSRLYRAAMGHIAKHRAGEVIDDDFGLMHLSHALCMIMMLYVHQRDGLGTDDRFDVWPTSGACG